MIILYNFFIHWVHITFVLFVSFSSIFCAMFKVFICVKTEIRLQGINFIFLDTLFYLEIRVTRNFVNVFVYLWSQQFQATEG